MNETDRITQALAQVAGIATVTRGWPKQSVPLPCAAVTLIERSAADTRDDAAYLTKQVYLLRIFAPTMGGCDALREGVSGAMEALGYTLSRVQEHDGEAAQLRMTFEKLE